MDGTQAESTLTGREPSTECNPPLIEQVWRRFLVFNKVFDTRFEDLTREKWGVTVYRDFSAGLIVALTAIPMAMGFAMAMGLRPEQGIIAGALACIVGRTWGGSKYQVYGPTAAFIPIIAGLMMKYGHPVTGGNFEQAHGLLVLCSAIAGVVLMFMGIMGWGKIIKRIPNSIVVGFTIGISVVIALSNIGEVFGLRHPIRGEFFEKLGLIAQHIGEFNIFAFTLAILTFVLIRVLLKVSIFIPAPLVALVLGTVLAETLFANKGVADVAEKFGSIPSNFLVFTPPVLPAFTPQLAVDVVYFAVAIVFVSGIESLLCSSMADRLANNKKTPFDADKELWGQGLVQLLVPVMNGFPCTGALARTATSIKAGAVSPLAGYFKGGLKIALAMFLAPWLEMVPLACIGGILLWVSTNMVKPAEVKEVWREGKLDAFLMVFTAVMVPLTDFLTGVCSALLVHFVARFFVGRKAVQATCLACSSAMKEDANALMERLRVATQPRAEAVSMECAACGGNELRR
ncbi:MAG: hypothetical protein K2W95_28410 [Candidatus Obscuribacterales bacterium]|nr:hypothetical protein [Candidatus Obscuribacterales bacterium]